MTLYVLGTPESLPASLRDEEGNVYPVQPMTGAPIPGGATQSTFVFQPGGVASTNVFTSFTALYAALNVAAPASANGTRSPTTIQFDDSFVSPAVIPPGTYNLDSVTWDAVASDATASGGAAVSIPAGVSIVAGQMRMRGALQITVSQATDVVTVGAGEEFNLWGSESIDLQCTAAGHLVNVNGAGAFGYCFVTEGSLAGDGVHAVFNLGAAGGMAVDAYTCSLAAGAVTGAGAQVRWQDAAPQAQGAGVVVQQVNGYIPATPGNWNPVPSTQSTALDALAAVAHNHVQGIQAFGAAAHAITTANLAHTTQTGHTRCFVSCSVSSAAAGDDIGFQLNLDGVPTGPVMGASSAIIGAAVSVAIQYDFAPAPGAHNYSITATSGSAANLTGIQAIVQVQELLS